MDGYQLPLSKKPLQRQIIVSGIGVLLICGFATFFFNRFVTFAPDLQNLFLGLLWFILPGAWLVTSAAGLLMWPKTSYVLTDNALSVRKKGWFGNSQEELYRYDTILSVSSKTKAYGKYGIVTLSMNQQQDDIVINGVAKPEEQSARIKEMVTKHRAGMPIV